MERWTEWESEVMGIVTGEGGRGEGETTSRRRPRHRGPGVDVQSVSSSLLPPFPREWTIRLERSFNTASASRAPDTAPPQP